MRFFKLPFAMESYFSYLCIVVDKIWSKIRYFYIRYFDPSIFVFSTFRHLGVLATKTIRFSLFIISETLTF